MSATNRFDPDRWWTWPIPEAGTMGTRPNGVPRLNSYGDGWVDGFEAGRNSLAEEILGWDPGVETA